MHSRETQDWLRREARRLRFRRIRIGGLLALLLAAGMWGILNYRADNFTFAWDRPFDVLVVAVVDPATSTRGESLDALFHRFLHGTDAIDGNLSGIEKWIREERDRFAPGDGAAPCWPSASSRSAWAWGPCSCTPSSTSTVTSIR